MLINSQTSKTITLPPSLKKGETIAIIAPAKFPKEGKDHVDRCIHEIIRRGFKVKLASNLMTRYGFLAGPDEERAAAFMECWNDPEVKALWCYRGGYGSGRILPLLDYEAISSNPKILIGMSDITALLNAITLKSEMVTFLGPNAELTLMGKKEGEDSFTENELWNQISLIHANPYVYPQHHYPFNPWTIRSGKAQGKLIGGNLSLIASMVGTPWQIETKGTILILEDIGEEPYRIDRMLLQLKQAELLNDVAGLILCSWSKCVSKDPSCNFTIEDVLNNYFENVNYPVLMGFPSGHVPYQVTLPIGVLAELDAFTKTLTLLGSPVSAS